MSSTCCLWAEQTQWRLRCAESAGGCEILKAKVNGDKTLGDAFALSGSEALQGLELWEQGRLSWGWGEGGGRSEVGKVRAERQEGRQAGRAGQGSKPSRGN